MASAGIGNPAGLVTITDFGNPKIITGYAMENISGGVFVFGSSAANVVSSGLNSFVTSDLKFVGDASGAQFNGIAIADAGSNTLVSVATEGVFILATDGTVTNGYPVVCAGNNAIRNANSNSGSISNTPIGRALTSAGSNQYAVVEIK